MIVKKVWRTIKVKHGMTTAKTWRGWFLFGIIPLYIEQMDLRIY